MRWSWGAFVDILFDGSWSEAYDEDTMDKNVGRLLDWWGPEIKIKKKDSILIKIFFFYWRMPWTQVLSVWLSSPLPVRRTKLDQKCWRSSKLRHKQLYSKVYNVLLYALPGSCECRYIRPLTLCELLKDVSSVWLTMGWLWFLQQGNQLISVGS